MRHSDLIYREDLLSGGRILITGGGTGLGRMAAEACLLTGAQVYICGRRQQVLAQAADEMMTAHGGSVTALTCDIRSEDEIAALIQAIWNDGGALTGLVNNAAGNFISPTERLSAKGYDAVANIVARGSFLMTLECGKRWLAEGVEAAVVSILVSWVWNGSPYVLPSAMSKAAIRAMTESLAVEWGGRGVRLNAIAPGIFPTEGSAKRLNPTGNQAARPANPMNRKGRMPELANLLLYLLSPASQYMNGETITIDGGDYLATGANFHHLRDWTQQDWADARDAIYAVNQADRDMAAKG